MPERSAPQASPTPAQRTAARRLAGKAYWRSRRVVRRSMSAARRRSRQAISDSVAAARQRAHRPEVSIVVPVYNVERYLRGCLKSIVAQTFDDVEVILIDDGSTDGSAAIAKEFRAADPGRIRYYRQRNAGLGAARNAGVRRARGTYLMFVDSDDTITRSAVHKMLTTIKSTGSDFVVGAPQRIEDGLKRVPRWVTDLHGHADLQTTIWKRPDMILDVFAWNKLYSMAFYRSAQLSFTEGVYYEDQIPSANAYLAATSFDVLPDIVYNWITRTGASSITQTTAEIKNLRDRITVTHQVQQILRERANHDIRRAWLDSRILGNDISLYLKDVDWVSEEYYSEIKRWLSGLFDEGDWHEEYASPPMKRLLAWAILHGDRATVEVLRQLERSNPGGLPTHVEQGRVHVSLGDLDPNTLAGAPADLFRIVDQSLQLSTNLRTLRWASARVLELGGWAFIRNVDLTSHATEITVELCTPDGTPVLSAATQPAPHYRVTRRGLNRWSNYDASGFSAQIDLDELLSDPEREVDEVVVHVRVRTGGFERSGPVMPPQANGGAKWPVTSPSHRGLKVRPLWRRNLLHLRVQRAPIVVRGVEAVGEDVRVAIESPAAPRTAYLLKQTPTGLLRRRRAVVEAVGPDSYVVTFGGLARFLATGTNTKLRANVGTRVTFSMPLDAPELQDLGNGVTARRSTAGNLVLESSQPMSFVQGDDLDGTRWTLTGTTNLASLHDLVLVGPRYKLAPLACVVEPSGRFSVTFDLVAAEWGEAPRSLAPGFYQVRHDPQQRDPQQRDPEQLDPDKGPATVPQIRWSPEGLRRVPREFVDERYSVRSARNLAPSVEVLPDIGGDGVSPYYQRVLQRDVYQPAREAERKPAVLFESFHGRNLTDNPRVIFSELLSRETDLQMYWSVNDSSVGCPAGATPLVRHSAEWYRVLGSAKYLVNNSNWPPAFRQADHQVYLQTWHGTPLKRIGHDIQRVLFSYRNYLEMMDREASYWDALISPNEFCTEIFPHAFAYSGPILETGYPRNDVLVTDPEGAADRARRLLGLEDDPRSILLYAPTWRDDKFVGAPGRYQAVYHLNFAAFSAELGQDYLILVRGHSNTLLYGRKVNQESVIDVSRYPEIADLYALADVLVTDYSSVMFDYSVTAKPMLFLAADLNDYRDRVRGFYFDFEADAPGPIFSTTQELIDNLRRLGSVSQQYAERYAAFRRRFNALEDGRAAERVVDAVFGPALASDSGHAASTIGEPVGR